MPHRATRARRATADVQGDNDVLVTIPKATGSELLAVSARGLVRFVAGTCLLLITFFQYVAHSVWKGYPGEAELLTCCWLAHYECKGARAPSLMDAIGIAAVHVDASPLLWPGRGSACCKVVVWQPRGWAPSKRQWCGTLEWPVLATQCSSRTPLWARCARAHLPCCPCSHQPCPCVVGFCVASRATPPPFASGCHVHVMTSAAFCIFCVFSCCCCCCAVLWCTVSNPQCVHQQ